MKVAIPMPTPSKLGEVATQASGLFKPLMSVGNGWKGFIAIMTALIARFRGKIDKTINKMEEGWSQRGYGSAVNRTIEVYAFAIGYIIKFFMMRSKQKKVDKDTYSAMQTHMAVILRDKLLELGPTFIKLGQLLSTRIDVLPKEFIKELVLLQDQVPGFSPEKAMEIIESELGKPIDELFEPGSFSKQPLAAASLGQVHTARMRGTGKEVCVKVQRQGLKELFDMDLKNIKVLAKVLDALDPKADGAARDWVSIYEESARLLYQEINYEREAQNGIRFSENFKGVDWVKVPEFYVNMTTPQVITMEYVPGIKTNDIDAIEAAGINRKDLARKSAESYLTQICRHGFFHCDPHPGNLACDAQNGGRLIYYDFGMMDELKPETKKGLVDLIFEIYENNVKGVLSALEDIEVLKKGVDRVSVEKIARFFLDEFTAVGEGKQKYLNQMDPAEAKKIQRARRAQLGADLFSVGSDVPFKFPPTFTFVFRAFTSLDGIGKGLDKDYDLTKLAQPYLKELVDLRDGSAFVSALKAFGKKVGLRPVDLQQAIGQPRKVAYLENTITQMERGELKLRVRVLESEREFKRMGIVQDNMATAIAASAFLNLGVLLMSTSPAGKMTRAAKGALALAGFFGLQLPVGIIKLKGLEKKFASFEK